MCGICRTACPVFRVLLSETSSPRGKAVLVKKDVADLVFYRCALCKACTAACPSGVKIYEEVKGMRNKLVESGIETDANRRMMRNVREFGNPLMKLEEKGKKIKELNCC